MVNRTKVNDCHEEFAILGSTGNVYTVTITHKPNCSCPDFKKGYLCKHIFFVYLKVFRLNHDSQFIYQEALLSKKLRSIFANAVPDPTVLASKRVRDNYELLEEKDHNNIVWCIEGCGNNLHKDCFEQWKKSKNGDKVTCVYCRANWVDSNSKILINEEGYINLSCAQGMYTIRGYTNYF
ncbi:unnamed protein product [Rhizophagus irregularis]|nr:unnamed protein product [Rhizophagus irregularis]CAB5355552.1 unnamed protein product [Rhizophagus irregularis]